MTLPAPRRTLRTLQTLFGALVILLCGTTRADVVTVTVPLPEVRQSATPGGVRLEAAGFPLVALPHLPAVPLRTVRIALPPDADARTVRVVARPRGVDDRKLVGPLARGGPRLWLTEKGAVRDDSPYGRGRTRAATEWHAELERGRTAHATAVAVGTLRRWPVVSLALSPVQLDLGRGEMSVATAIDLDVSFERTRAVRPPRAGDEAFARLLRGAVANPDDVEPPSGEDGAPPTLIIAVQATLRAHMTRLEDYVAHKEAQGFQVVVITEADTNPGPFFGPPAKMLRGWLQRNWEALNATHLLIIADPDPSRLTGMPMALAYATPFEDVYNEPPGLPTDAYFADLTGDWDLDDDGQLAEWPDDFGTGGVDLQPELFVGRIPVHGVEPALADEALAHAMAHDTEPGGGTWRRRLLMPAAVLFYAGEEEYLDERQSGSEVAEWMRAGPVADKEFALRRLYEWDGLQPDTYESDGPLTARKTLDGFEEGFGLVFWLGHGSATATARRVWDDDRNHDELAQLDELSYPDFITTRRVQDELTLERGPFVFMGSCSNAEPEAERSLASALLLAGAAGTVGATRTTTGWANEGWTPDDGGGYCCFSLGARYMEALMGGAPAGEALAAARLRQGTWGGELSIRNKLEHNLYGDPTLGLKQCTVDTDCDDGLVCSGEERCDDGFCVAGDPPPCDAAADGVTVGPCELYACEESTHACALQPVPNGGPCDDGLYCTTRDACRDGVCAGGPTCVETFAECTVPTCLEDERRCDSAPAPDGAACRTPYGESGTCEAGDCAVPEAAPLPSPDARAATDTASAETAATEDGATEDGAASAAPAGADTDADATSGGCTAGAGDAAASPWALLLVALLGLVVRRRTLRPILD